jgi:hypothetical protein
VKSGTTTGTAYKIWQVHGNDAPYYGVGVVPVIISNANLDIRATAGTLVTTDVRRYGFWVSGAGALTGQTILGPVWKMGTTTIAGGTSGEPVAVESLEFALTKGKTRWSAIRQGANQMLCLQAVQFGDGGTSPVNLDLNATAIEFPSKRDVQAKLINYNGPDNAVGFTYYAGAADTIRHRASVISSPSPYHWRIHPSSSASATYDFSGLSLIGAGDVQLRPVTTFTGMTFTGCWTISTNASALENCTFNNSSLALGALSELGQVSGLAFNSTGFNRTPPYAISIASGVGTANLVGVGFAGFDTSSYTWPSDEYVIPCVEATAGDLLLLGPQGAKPVFSRGDRNLNPLSFTSSSKYYDRAISHRAFGVSGDQIYGYVLSGLPSVDVNGAFTVDFWYRPDGTNGGVNHIIGLLSLAFNIQISGNSDVQVSIGGSNFNVPLGTMTTGTWYHIAVSRAAGTSTIRVHRDGVQTGTTGSTAGFAGPTALLAKTSGSLGYAYSVQDVRYVPGRALYTSANFTPPGALLKKTALFIGATTGTVNVNVSEGASPSYTTAGATVNIVSGATVTFTGLPTGTDIVILTAGTTAILQQVDQHPTTSYAWTYSGTPTVDVGFIKPGFKVRYLRNLSLGTTDSSIPVELQPDPTYL